MQHINFLNRLPLGFSISRVFIVATLLCFFFTANLNAQNEQIEVEDVVLLKDGSVYRGVVVDEDDLFLYLVILDGQTIDILQSQVRRVLSNDKYIFHKRGRYHDTKGFFWALNLGFSPQEAEHTSLLVGYRFNKRWSLALGLGSEFSTTLVGGFDVETLFSSTFLYGRYYLTDNRRRLFAYGRLGYGAGPETEQIGNGRHGGGGQAQVGTGIHFASRKNSRFILSLGYHVQHTSGKQFYLDGFGNEIIVDYNNLFVRHLVFKFGIEFR